MTQWFYQIEGQVTGPVDTSELKRLAACCELLPTSMIRKEGSENWVPASKAKGLFQPKATSTKLQSSSDPVEARIGESRIRDDSLLAVSGDGVPFSVSPTLSRVLKPQTLMFFGLTVCLLVIVAFNVWYFAISGKHRSVATIPQQQESLDAKPAFEVQQKAPALAVIQGGAWLTKKAGNSEPIRGLNIYALPGQLPNVARIGMLDLRMSDLQKQLHVFEPALNNYLDEKPDTPEGLKKVQKGLIDSLRPVVEQLRLDIETTSKQLESAHKMSDSAFVPAHEVCIAVPLSDAGKIGWKLMCTKLRVAETTTDVDGKYSLSLPSGSYVIVADYDSAYSISRWAHSKNVQSGEAIRLDFQNDTAMMIFNKATR